MIKLKSLLQEYVSNPIISLGNYLKQTEEQKALEIGYEAANDYLFGFLKKSLYNNINQDDIKQIQKVEKVLKQYDNYDISELFDIIKEKNPKLFAEYIKLVYDKFKKDDLKNSYFETGYPSWKYLTFQKYIKNQWLIHFSDGCDGIWSSQHFKYGMDDYTKLGLTTYFGEKAKTGGYNFAYDIIDFAKYGRSSYSAGSWKYGKEAVLFKASGVKAYHNGDEEPQVIFWGQTANDIVHLQHNKGDDDWMVVNSKTSRIIYRNQTLSDVVKWVISNFNQYKRALLP